MNLSQQTLEIVWYGACQLLLWSVMFGFKEGNGKSWPDLSVTISVLFVTFFGLSIYWWRHVHWGYALVMTYANFFTWLGYALIGSCDSDNNQDPEYKD